MYVHILVTCVYTYGAAFSSVGVIIGTHTTMIGNALWYVTRKAYLFPRSLHKGISHISTEACVVMGGNGRAVDPFDVGRDEDS